MRKYWVFEAEVTSAGFSTYRVLDRTLADSFYAWVTIPVRNDGSRRPGPDPDRALNYVYGPFSDSNQAAVWAAQKTATEDAEILRAWMRG